MTKKKKKQEIDLSDTIVQVAELQRKFLFALVERQETAQAGLTAFARLLKEAKNDMFEVLFDFHPELKNYHFSYNAKKGEATILGKKYQRKK